MNIHLNDNESLRSGAFNIVSNLLFRTSEVVND